MTSVPGVSRAPSFLSGPRGPRGTWGALALAVACGLGAAGCGGESGTVAVGVIVLTGVDVDAAPGPLACVPLTPGVADPFPTTPTEFVISGLNFATVPGASARVRFEALGDARPFHKGTSGFQEVEGLVASDGQICGLTPEALVCGVASISATVEVFLESGVHDSSAAGPAFVITFFAPAVPPGGFVPTPIPALTPVPFTITGAFFGDDGDEVVVRFYSTENTAGNPDAGETIFGDGTTTQVDVTGLVSGGGTLITGITPKSTNQVDPPLANLLHVVSDDLEEAAVRIILANGSCSAGAGDPAVEFDRPEVDDVAPALVPQTIPTDVVLTGSGTDDFGPVGALVEVSFAAPNDPSDPLNAFVVTPYVLGTPRLGTAESDVVIGVITSPTTIACRTPVVLGRDALGVPVDFVPVIRVHFEDGTIAPVTTAFTWVAPPAPQDVTNLDGPSGNGFLALLAAGPANPFLGCLSTTMQIDGANFQAGATVQIVSLVRGETRHLGSGNPVPPLGQELGPVVTVVVPNQITGETRLDGLLAAIDPVSTTFVVRVTNPDGQIGEAQALWLTASDAAELGDDDARTRNNVSAAVDPTSSPDDFATAGLSDAVNGANLTVVASDDPDDSTGFLSTQVLLQFSRDGGVNWTLRTVSDDGFAADALRNFAMVAYDRFGNLWLSYLVDDFTADVSRIVLRRSTDQGATFPVTLVVATGAAGDFDRPCLAVGPNGSNPATLAAAYVSWVNIAPADPQVFASGVPITALGASGAAVAPQQVDDAVLVGFNLSHARCAVGPGGELYVAWVAQDLLPPNRNRIEVDRDRDGLFVLTQGWDTDTLAATTEPLAAPLAASPDAGPPLPLLSAAVIPVGTFAGRLVLAFEDVQPVSANPQHSRLVTVYSDDNGFTWPLGASSVHVVDEADQFLPALVADPRTGRLYVTWYDTAVAPAVLANDTARRMSAASDDGIRWGRALDLFPATPSPQAVGDGEFTDFGVQSGLAALGGCVYAFWCVGDSGAGQRMNVFGKTYQQTATSDPPGGP